MAVEAINRKKALVLMVGGSTVPVSNWLDHAGDECEEPYAHFAIAGPAIDGRFHTLLLADFEDVETH